MKPEPKPIKTLVVKRNPSYRCLDVICSSEKAHEFCRENLARYGRILRDNKVFGKDITVEFTIEVWPTFDFDEVVEWLESYSDEPEPEEEQPKAYRVYTDLLCNSKYEAGERLIRIGVGIIAGHLRFRLSEDHEFGDMEFFAKD